MLGVRGHTHYSSSCQAGIGYQTCIIVELMPTEEVSHSDVLTVVGIEGLNGQLE